MKHLLLTATAALALSLLFASPAIADRISNPEFSKTMRLIEDDPSIADTRSVYGEGSTSVDQQTVAAFSEIANDQAQIWGDTILEGDYEADGNTQLDSIEALIVNGQFVGYRVFYSERAWNTATCNYRGGGEGLDQCQEGRIQEASFVSPELNSWTRDSNSYAEFQ